MATNYRYFACTDNVLVVNKSLFSLQGQQQFLCNTQQRCKQHRETEGVHYKYAKDGAGTTGEGISSRQFDLRLKTVVCLFVMYVNFY